VHTKICAHTNFFLSSRAELRHWNSKCWYISDATTVAFTHTLMRIRTHTHIQAQCTTQTGPVATNRCTQIHKITHTQTHAHTILSLSRHANMSMDWHIWIWRCDRSRPRFLSWGRGRCLRWHWPRQFYRIKRFLRSRNRHHRLRRFWHPHTPTLLQIYTHTPGGSSSTRLVQPTDAQKKKPPRDGFCDHIMTMSSAILHADTYAAHACAYTSTCAYAVSRVVCFDKCSDTHTHVYTCIHMYMYMYAYTWHTYTC